MTAQRDAVPVIDLDGDPTVVGRDLDAVCTEIGFFQVVGHGVPAGVVDAAWEAATTFFDLPLADKMAAASPSPGYPYGYVPMAGESLNRSLGADALPDLKEVFNAGPFEVPGSTGGTGPGGAGADADESWVWLPTPWPAALPELREAWHVYYDAMLALATRVMSLFARGLALPADHFAGDVDRSPSALRAIRYPARDAAPQPGQLRAGAHTDYGTLTLLRQDTVGGLEVATADGAWAPVPSVPDAFVVNIGDLMARWTNDRWRSTLHRVVDPVTRSGTGEGSYAQRHSMPFFHNANWDARVEALPTCLGPGEQPRHAPVLAGPHLMAKFRRTVA